MTDRNYSAKPRNGLKVIATEPFQRGYSEFRTGIPLNYDAYLNSRDQTRYERGRLFAQVDIIGKKKLRVSMEAVRRFNEAFVRKEIV
jgi:hypothetical protein